MFSGWISCSLPRATLTPVKSRNAPKTNSSHSKRLSSATPANTKMARRINAPKMPQNSTRCWYSLGTEKYPKITAHTNTLSTERLFSIT